jgi:hypothetical protein
MLWPPNHRLVPVQLGQITDPDGDPISLEMTVTQDEPDRKLGRRDLTPDVAWKSGTLYLRAERSKHGDGREYTIKFKAADGKGGTCSGEVKVTVPHDRGDKRGHHQDREDDDDDNKDGKSKHGDKDDGKSKSVKAGGFRR